jgi:quinol monooxygenase YgiN
VSNQIRAIAEMRIRPGVDAATALACLRRISARTEAVDRGTLAHNYYVDAQRGLLVAHEHYEDPAAMMAHLSGMDPADIAVLVGAVEITSMRLFGPATAELRATLASFGTAEYFDFVSGFTR